ncbi:uncharacterized protein LOC18009645 isoform X1 [Eutrema salsugineum]|uniref:uncharacterized protein LOC18009645 isoform X1 n=1 Tax=Eutrema salsugineum TaxID=72664 RepID=UPI000CED4535|nr:uncharacterized protein LOC18009645 isoform X1 [Eutrema salsugineum]
MDVPKVLRFWLIYVVLLFDSQRHSVYAQAGGVIGGAGILVQRAAFCFNNNLLYRGCNEAFRLNQGGEFKVPLEDTDRFCNGPCAAETELVLKCINSVMSDFVFYNRATPRDIRNALRGGCSNSFTRGFNYETFPSLHIIHNLNMNLFCAWIYRKLQRWRLYSRTIL